MRFIILLAALAAAGCQGAKVVPVNGKITFANGKPVPQGTKVLFRPEAGGNMAGGVTDRDGNYKLAVGPKEGAEPGKYFVVIQPPEDDKTVPPKYAEGSLTAEVRENMPPLDFKLEPKK